VFSRATQASSEVNDVDDDFIRQTEETQKVINFIDKFEHLKNKLNSEQK
tara:strand:+ start:331 stop:477 length:147 start_codon:yes stop_codon:yes gene_type:complete